jgi:hypothetical protein
MSASVECEVCRREVSPGAWVNEPLPLSLRCPHCSSQYGIRESSHWRWLSFVLPIAICTSAFVSLVSWAFLRGHRWELVGLVAYLFVGKLAIIMQSALGRRLYQWGKMRLIEEGARVLPSWPMCQSCEASISSSKACCPMCGAELGRAAAVAPLKCPQCGEHLRFEEVRCPACRSPMGIAGGGQRSQI